MVQPLQVKATNNKNSPHRLTQDAIGPTLIRMTMPMILGMFMTFSFSLVDTFFVSMMGTEALSAISFTFPVTFAMMSLAIGLSIGTSAVVAKYIGRGEMDKARKASTVTTYVAILSALVLAAIGYILLEPIFRLMGAPPGLMPLIREYMDIWLPTSVLLVAMVCGNAVLRANGDTRTPSLVMAGAGLVNAIFDPLLIFGWGPIPAMGMQGAALASLVSWMAAVAWLFHVLVIRNELISRRLPSFLVFRDSAREMLKIGIPASGANMLTPVAAGVMTAIVAGHGETAVAAFGVGSRLETIACLVILALSTTLPPLVSQNLGAGRIDRVEDACRLAMRFILGWQLVIYVALVLFGSLIARVFTQNPEVAAIIQLYLWIVPLSYGFQGIVILCNSALNALHRPMIALYLSIARFFVFYVPLAWVGSMLYGLPGFFVGALLGNVATAVASWITFKRVLAAEKQQHS